MGTVKIEPPLPIKPNETPINAAKIKPAISIIILFALLQRCGKIMGKIVTIVTIDFIHIWMGAVPAGY